MENWQNHDSHQGKVDLKSTQNWSLKLTVNREIYFTHADQRESTLENATAFGGKTENWEISYLYNVWERLGMIITEDNTSKSGWSCLVANYLAIQFLGKQMALESSLGSISMRHCFICEVWSQIRHSPGSNPWPMWDAPWNRTAITSHRPRMPAPT